jgi:hypothetical protein
MREGFGSHFFAWAFILVKNVPLQVFIQSDYPAGLFNLRGVLLFV